MSWLDRLPLKWLAVGAIWLSVAPIVPEPHLVEKLRMLAQGTLVRTIDIFDLLLHGVPLLLLPLMTYRLWLSSRTRRDP